MGLQTAVHVVIQEYGVDTLEIEGSLNDYRSLNEFFARRLRPGARPIDSPGYAPYFLHLKCLLTESGQVYVDQKTLPCTICNLEIILSSRHTHPS